MDQRHSALPDDKQKMNENSNSTPSSSRDLRDLPPSYSEHDESDAIEMEESKCLSHSNEYLGEGEELRNNNQSNNPVNSKGKCPKKQKRICPVCNGSHRRKRCPPQSLVSKMCPKCEKFHAGKCPIIIVQDSTVIDLEQVHSHPKADKFNCLRIVALLTFVPIVLGLVAFGFYEVFSAPLEFTPASQMADAAIVAQFSKVAVISQFSYFSIMSQISICSVFSMFSVCSFASLFSLLSFYGLFTCTAVYSGVFSFWIIKKD